MTLIEPRLAERRKGVKEDRARGRLKWIIITIVAIGLVVGAVWLIRSPVLSIREVEISGAQKSDPASAINQLSMGVGTPTIDVDTAAIQTAVESDPWVARAIVDVSWPGAVSVVVTEYVPFASVRAGDAWVQAAGDGAVVPGSGPLVDAARIDIDTGPVSAGYQLSNPLILGGLEFAEALSPELAAVTIVQAEGEGLVATIEDHRIILGRPVDMADKARVVETLLATGLEPDASINVIAPLRPAVTNPQPEQEVEE